MRDVHGMGALVRTLLNMASWLVWSTLSIVVAHGLETFVLSQQQAAISPSCSSLITMDALGIRKHVSTQRRTANQV